MSEMEKILEDIRTYLRITAAAASRPVAKSVIDTLEKAEVYEKLGAGKSQRKVEEETKIPQTTVSSWVGRFIEAGLASPQGKPLFTLKELCINISELGKRRKEQAANQQETESKPSPTAAEGEATK